MSELVLYTTEDGQSRIQLRVDNETIWLTQLEMAELFSEYLRKGFVIDDEHLKNPNGLLASAGG